MIILYIGLVIIGYGNECLGLLWVKEIKCSLILDLGFLCLRRIFVWGLCVQEFFCALVIVICVMRWWYRDYKGVWEYFCSFFMKSQDFNLIYQSSLKYHCRQDY